MYRYDMAWLLDPQAVPAPQRLRNKLGLAALGGVGNWIWRAVKLGWRLSDSLDVRDEIAIFLAKKTWRVIERQNAEWKAEISRWEADQRLLVEALAQRHVRLNSGSKTERIKWMLIYAREDKLRELYP